VELETEAEGVQGVELMWCVSLDSIHPKNYVLRSSRVHFNEVFSVKLMRFLVIS
jgi:hypothetical protein